MHGDRLHLDAYSVTPLQRLRGESVLKRWPQKKRSVRDSGRQEVKTGAPRFYSLMATPYPRSLS
jgi:hypothetical protein